MLENLIRNIPPVVKNFLIINLLVFLATILYSSGEFILIEYLASYFVLNPNFEPYQIITHMFTHAGIAHIFFNMFALVMFGVVLERVLGSRRFFIFYFACGIGAMVLFQVVAYFEYSYYLSEIESGNTAEYIINGLASVYHIPAVGASGAIFGMLMLFMLMYPETEFILFPIPFTVKAKYYLPILIYIEFFLGIQQLRGNGSNVAHFAHLGGALIGLIFFLIWRKKRLV